MLFEIYFEVDLCVGLYLAGSVSLSRGETA
jgi:hypothetical protein